MTSSFLRGSENYVWITTNVLGKGATAAVFQGVHKKNGGPVAVKTFNPQGHSRHPDVQLREFEVIQKVNHENIVKLLAIEEEQDGRGKVIVMELCTGGSLFTILDDPENTYGLQEEEFLLVLEHLTAGMKHLRDNNLVHRDLKPGNIMKFIADDGRTIYKLTDFGAARELQEDQQFMSLYGTEEYLHPDMYERAVLHKSVVKSFDATVDLWSIGVTLYHVATGNLPFRPFGGRRNKQTMHLITTKKASGVISGIQTRENGPIEWSRELPGNCQLSSGLKRLVIPLLAGLMEADTQRVWSFDRFFSEVMNILSRKLLHIFFLNRAQSIRVYLHPEGTYEEMQSLIRDQTDVTPANQVLLLKDSPLLALVEENTPGRGYPTSEETNPIMLLSKDNSDVSPASETDLPDFPAFPHLVSIETDASTAKVACSVGHECKRRIEKLARTSVLNSLCVQVLTTVRSKDLKRVLTLSERLQELTRYAEQIVAAVTRSCCAIQELCASTGNDQNLKRHDWQAELVALRGELTCEVAPAIQQLHQRYVTEGTLLCQWSTTTRDIPCPAQTRTPNRAQTLVDRLRDSWQHLLRDRATRSLSYNEDQFHKLERIKVDEFGRQLRMLLDRETAPHLAQQAECMADWYKVAQTVTKQTQILEEDIINYERRLENFFLRIVDADCRFHEELMMKLLTQRGEERRQKPTPPRPISSNRDLYKLLREVRSTQREVAEVVQENNALAGELIKAIPPLFDGL